jgi:hypothetical protein
MNVTEEGIHTHPKQVEQYVGYGRTQDEFGGDWAMAQYIEACETNEESLRSQVLG